MTIVVFVGPTLKSSEVSDCVDAAILPPVRQGDVYRVARENPKAIGIIDGFFEGVPSVWHKEILWAMEQGIPVFGSASMGALRAAELADFGMIGVGRIFEDYYNGVLQDDDEVAVLHSPAELGFKPLSEPMVSIRATIESAEKAGLLPPEIAAEMVQQAKSMHYRNRRWNDITGAMEGRPGVSEFEKWLPTGRVDAKATDAREMLTRMSAHLSVTPLPSSDPVRTEPTLMWKALRARVDTNETSDHNAVVDELRLNPKLFSRLRERAVLTLLLRKEGSRQDRQPDRDALVKQMVGHKADIGLVRQSDLMEWIETNDLTPESYEAMLADWARLEQGTTLHTGKLDALLLSELRRTNQYAELRDRALNKAQNVGSPTNASADRLRMLMWYFETCLDRDIPDDLESYAVSLGLDGRDAFYKLIEAEFSYCQNDEALSSSAE